jgi:hypothetical protein
MLSLSFKQISRSYKSKLCDSELIVDYYTVSSLIELKASVTSLLPAGPAMMQVRKLIFLFYGMTLDSYRKTL